MAERQKRNGLPRVVLMIAGVAMVSTGVLGISVGSIWAPAALQFFASNESVQKFELIIPFLPILLIAFGAYLAVYSRKIL